MEEPLEDQDALAGARFLDYCGRRTPADFGDPQAEYLAVRQTVGLLDLSWRSLVRFTGEDRTSFLHGMTTNHILGLEAGQAQQNTCCDATGHLVGVFRLSNMGDALWADLHPACAEACLAILEKHLIMEEVEIAEMHAAWGILSLQGPSAPRACAQLLGAEPAPPENRVVNGSFGGKPAYFVGSSHTGEPGVDLIAPRDTLPDLWSAALSVVQEAGGRPVGLDALRVLRVEAGIPWWGEDLDGTLLMLEAGLKDAIHFEKGCYLGQETLARIHFRGHTNRELTGLRLSGGQMPERGARLSSLDGSRDAGWVTTAVSSPRLDGPIALAIVRREFLAPGTPLRVETAACQAVVEELPFRPAPGSASH